VPTVLRVKSFRFHFYSDECDEPPHIHIETPDGECKFWLENVKIARNKGLPAHIIQEIEKLVYANKEFLTEKYNEFHKH